MLTADLTGISFHAPDVFRLEGFHWRKKGGAFRRLPVNSAARAIPAEVDRLADFSAGGQVYFRSDSSRVVVRAVFSAAHKIVRMALTGTMGFDLYTREGADTVFRGVANFDFDAMEYCVELSNIAEYGMRDYILNFPLYAKLERLEIGLDQGAKILPAPARPDSRPIVAYGTSILQGACATRPGLCYTNILSRLLDRPVLNFGFAGNARGEPALARILSQIREPALFLLDYDANAGAAGVRKTLPEFIGILRQRHPQVPVVTVSCVPFPADYPKTPAAVCRSGKMVQCREAHEEVVWNLRAQGDENLHYVDGFSLLGQDYWECSVDACHLSDLGFYRMAAALGPELRRILGDAKR